MATQKQSLSMPTENKHTLVVVSDGESVTLRIQKDGHNRGIAKISSGDAQAISEFLIFQHHQARKGK